MNITTHTHTHKQNQFQNREIKHIRFFWGGREAEGKSGEGGESRRGELNKKFI